MIRIVIADDHPIVRAGIIKTLESEPEMQIVAEAGSGRDAVAQCEKHKPDILVLDFDMPEMDGLEVTRILAERMPEIRIIVLTVHKSEDFAIRFMQVGAKGFVPKLAAADELATAIRLVASGRIYLAPASKDNAAARASGETLISSLTGRELQFLICLASGKSVREISEEYAVSASTVKTMKTRIQEKLNLRNVADITRFAIENDLLT